MHLIVGSSTSVAKVFLVGEYQTENTFFDMPSCLETVAQMLFRHNWKERITASLLLPFFNECSCVVYWRDFIQSGVRFQVEVFAIEVIRKRSELDRKSYLTTIWLILSSLVRIRLTSSTSYLLKFEIAGNTQVWSSFDHIKSFG